MVDLRRTVALVCCWHLSRDPRAAQRSGRSAASAAARQKDLCFLTGVAGTGHAQTTEKCSGLSGQSLHQAGLLCSFAS